MKRIALIAALTALFGCEDSGPVPFNGPEIFGSGGKSGGGGGGGASGGSGFGGTAGFGGSSGASSCAGQCGSSSQQPSGCYCDSQCQSKGDCCPDYTTYCGGSSCPTDWKYNSLSCDTCMRSSCCSILQACDSGTACRDVDTCRFANCKNASDITSCMNSYCTSYGSSALATWFEYWNCMIGNCGSPCSG